MLAESRVSMSVEKMVVSMVVNSVEKQGHISVDKKVVHLVLEMVYLKVALKVVYWAVMQVPQTVSLMADQMVVNQDFQMEHQSVEQMVLRLVEMLEKWMAELQEYKKELLMAVTMVEQRVDPQVVYSVGLMDY